MANKKATQHLICAWQAYRDYRFSQGEFSCWRIARELAAGFSTGTIARHLDERIRIKSNYSNHRYQERIRDTRTKSREKSQKNRAKHGEQVRKYERQYRRLTRTFERYLDIAFAIEKERTLEAITTSIRDACEGVNFQPKTIERVLKKYADGQNAGTICGPPYLYKADDSWRYNNDTTMQLATRQT